MWTRALIPLAPHRTDHAERGERVYEGRCARFGADFIGQHQAIVGAQGSLYCGGIEAAARRGHGLAEQCLCRRGCSPAAITVPAGPSLPIGRDWPGRARRCGKAAGSLPGIKAGRAPRSVFWNAWGSAAESRTARSDGLIGAASTRTSTSPSAGCGTSNSAKDSSSSPSSSGAQRICKAVRGRGCRISFSNRGRGRFRDPSSRFLAIARQTDRPVRRPQTPPSKRA